eukprot:jgi/Chlat1/2437/Chrsp17S02681
MPGPHRFVTQRTDPRLALVKTSLPAEALLMGPKGWGGDAASLPPDAALVVTAPGMDTLHVVSVTVWGWTGRAADEGDEAATWFSQYLRRPVRLIRYEPSVEERPVENVVLTSDVAQQQHTVGFADGFPILVASEASLEALNARMPVPLPMNRFRPNVVVSGCGAWAEDAWARYVVGSEELVLLNVKACTRCKVTTTDQETGEVGKEPLQTLRVFRTVEKLGLKGPGYSAKEVCFAQNAVVDSITDRSSNTHMIHVGDSLTILTTA